MDIRCKETAGKNYIPVMRLITALALVFILILLTACGEKSGIKTGRVMPR